MSDHALAARWRALRAEGRPGLVTYVTAGHPTPDATIAALRMLQAEGADVIELGIPFSDPLADGPTIQDASFAALKRGVSVRSALDMLSAADVRTPVVAFSYLNPVLAYGPEQFLADAAAAGASGLLLTDLPAGGDPPLERTMAGGPLALIRLVAPTTTAARLATMEFDPRGFVYLIARLGVTGAATPVSADLGAAVRRVRTVTDLPVAVGFGIRDPKQARAMAAEADAVVVGSALVERLAEGLEPARALVCSMREALDGAVVRGRA